MPDLVKSLAGKADISWDVSVEDGWRGVYPNGAMRTSAAPHEEGAVTSLVEPPRAPDLAPPRERPPELNRGVAGDSRAGSRKPADLNDARLWHPWLRINRVLRVMLHTRWSAGA